MPGRNGTGPLGTGPIGRRLGPCRFNEPVTQATGAEKETAGTEKAENQTPVTYGVGYGVGRGGRPRGCGRGFCSGGRRRW